MNLLVQRRTLSTETTLWIYWYNVDYFQPKQRYGFIGTTENTFNRNNAQTVSTIFSGRYPCALATEQHTIDEDGITEF